MRRECRYKRDPHREEGRVAKKERHIQPYEKSKKRERERRVNCGRTERRKREKQKQGEKQRDGEGARRLDDLDIQGWSAV